MKNDITGTIVNKAKESVSGMFNFAQIDSDLTVWFAFEGREYELSQMNIKFEQWVDSKGQPQNEVRGGKIVLTITETLPENLYKWAMTSCMKDGAIEFRSKTSSAPLKIGFNNGYCVDFERVVSANGGVNTVLVISSEIVTVNGITVDNRWV